MPAIRDYAQNYTATTTALGLSVPMPAYAAGDLAVLYASADTGTQVWAAGQVVTYAWTYWSAAYADQTTAAQSTTTGDTYIINTAVAVGDCCYWGDDTPFNMIGALVSTAGVYSVAPTWVWEYWNGSAWTALTLTATGITYNAATGWRYNSFYPPTDWTAASPGGAMPSKYFVRQRQSVAGTLTTRPVYTQFTIGKYQQLYSATNTVNHGILYKLCTASELAEQWLHYTTAETTNGGLITVRDADQYVHFATTQVAAMTYNESNVDSYQNLGDATTTKVSQSFAATAGKLASVKFYLKKNGSPTGNIQVFLYTHSGVLGTSSVPTGVALAKSQVYSAAALTGTAALIEFAFDWHYDLTATNYCISIEYSGGDASNYVQVGYDASASGHAGNKATYAAAAWTAQATHDCAFYAAQFTYTTGTATAARSALPQVTTSRDNSLVLWQASNAGTATSTLYLGAIIEGPCSFICAKDGTAHSDAWSWGWQKAAGATSAAVYQSNLGTGTQTISTGVLAINPPSTGATVIPAYCSADASVYVSPMTGVAYNGDSAPANTVTTPFTGTINGCPVAVGGTTVTRADTGINSYHAMTNFTGVVTNGSFGGIRCTVVSRNLSGKNLLFHIQPYLPVDIQVADSVALTGACGVAIGLASSAGNFKVWHVGGSATPWGTARHQPAVIHVSNTTGLLQTTGTLSTTAVVDFGFLVSSKVVASNWLVGSVWALDTTTVCGGIAAEPIKVPDIVRVASDGFERRSVIQEGSAQMLVLQPLQFGDGGTNPVYLNLDGTAIEFPQIYSKADKTVSYCSIDNFAGITYYPGASDTIKHKNGVVSSKSRYKWGLHSSASTSATYDFSGLSVIGAGTITLARAITVTGLTINDYTTIDATGLTFDQGVIKGCPAASASLTVSAATVIKRSAINVSGVTAGNYWTTTTTPVVFENNAFTGGGGHAIRITTAGTYTFVGNTFASFGVDGSTGAAILNESGGLVTLNITGGGGTLTVKNIGGATTVINLAVAVAVHVEDESGVAIQGAQVYLQKSTPTAYTAGAGNTAGNATLVMTQAIASDTPGTGSVNVFDKSIANQYSLQTYRYASYTGSTFTLLTEVTYNCTGGGTGTSLQDTVHNFTTLNIREGDTVRNTTDGSWAVVDEIVSATQITTTPLQGGADNTWTSGDTYSFHKLATTLESGIDTVDVPIILGATDASGNISVSFPYVADRAVVIRVRHVDGTTKYVQVKTASTITSSGMSVSVVMVRDTTFA
jgi:hypothetical protein